MDSQYKAKVRFEPNAFVMCWPAFFIKQVAAKPQGDEVWIALCRAYGAEGANDSGSCYRYPNAATGSAAVSTHTLLIWVYSLSASSPLERP